MTEQTISRIETVERVWISRKEAMQLYNIKSPQTLRKYIKKGVIVARWMCGIQINKPLTDEKIFLHPMLKNVAKRGKKS